MLCSDAELEKCLENQTQHLHGSLTSKVVKMIEPNTKANRGDHWICRDTDGTLWRCKREPFNNEMGKWFVKLESYKENYEDVMTKIEGEDHDV